MELTALEPDSNIMGNQIKICVYVLAFTCIINIIQIFDFFFDKFLLIFYTFSFLI